MAFRLRSPCRSVGAGRAGQPEGAPHVLSPRLPLRAACGAEMQRYRDASAVAEWLRRDGELFADDIDLRHGPLERYGFDPIADVKTSDGLRTQRLRSWRQAFDRMIDGRTAVGYLVLRSAQVNAPDDLKRGENRSALIIFSGINDPCVCRTHHGRSEALNFAVAWLRDHLLSGSIAAFGLPVSVNPELDINEIREAIQRTRGMTSVLLPAVRIEIRCTRMRSLIEFPDVGGDH